MQGCIKLKHLALLMLPLIAACTTPDRTQERANALHTQSGEGLLFDNCSVGCPSGVVP